MVGNGGHGTRWPPALCVRLGWLLPLRLGACATSISMYLMPVPKTATYMTMNTISVIESSSAEWFDTASFVRITP